MACPASWPRRAARAETGDDRWMRCGTIVPRLLYRSNARRRPFQHPAANGDVLDRAAEHEYANSRNDQRCLQDGEAVGHPSVLQAVFRPRPTVDGARPATTVFGEVTAAIARRCERKRDAATQARPPEDPRHTMGQMGRRLCGAVGDKPSTPPDALHGHAGHTGPCGAAAVASAVAAPTIGSNATAAVAVPARTVKVTPGSF